MKIPVKLQELLQQPESTIISIGALIGQGLAVVDCTGVETVTPELLNIIFTNIPNNWDFKELREIFDFYTFTDTFNTQLSQYVDQRLGRTQPPVTNQPPITNYLDIFNFRNEVIGDYRNYIESFLKIRDSKVKAFVDAELEKGQLWTDPLVQLNPTYKKGATVTELVQQGVLHPDCQQYFSKDGKPFTFHYHQKQAFETAQRQEPYVVTTGTGSGKSLTYVVPIINDLLHHCEVKGVRAILVYPMNALINSQEEEIKKFLDNVPNTHITVAKYTGQESLTRKSEIQNNPPHILLTNYVMLELMLSRTHENKLVESADLKFLVLDELHTYRGRQGADVAILIRKLQQRNRQTGRMPVPQDVPHSLLCIGTSATMSTQGGRQQRRQVVADVASKLFGVEIKPSNVIDETLERSIKRAEQTVEELRESVVAGLPSESEQTLENFQQHPLSYWIEMNFGLKEEEDIIPTGKIIGFPTKLSTNNIDAIAADKSGKYRTSPKKSVTFVRRTPITLKESAEKLAEICEHIKAPLIKGGWGDQYLNILKQMFLWGSKTKGLAFRLHQFILKLIITNIFTTETMSNGQNNYTDYCTGFPACAARDINQNIAI